MPKFRNSPVDVAIDVRTHVEYWLGHLPGAICIPLQKLAHDVPAHEDITKDSRILVYCASGARSANATELLRSLGYRRVVDGGGINQARGDFTE